MSQPSRKTLLALLRRWMDEHYPYPPMDLIEATGEAFRAADEAWGGNPRNVQLPGQSDIWGQIAEEEARRAGSA